MKFFFLKKNGFSILDVVIAIGLIAMAMVGVLALMTQSIQAYSINKNRLVATLLAQEGVELVRNLRDSNWLQSIAWNQTINDSAYAIDKTSVYAAVNDIAAPGARLKMDNNGLYQYVGGVDTIFYRLISTDTSGCPNATDCLHVTAAVQWTQRGQAHATQLQTYLYNWR